MKAQLLQVRASFAASLGIVLLAAACGGNGGGNGGDCETDHELTGTWTSTFSCVSGCGNFNGNDTLVVTQSGTQVTFSIAEEPGSSFAGEICGDTFEWQGAGDGYTEQGEWRMTGARSFTKVTSYASAGCSGSCTGSGQRR